MDGIKVPLYKFALSAVIFTAAITTTHASKDIQATADILKNCLDKNIAQQATENTTSKDAVIANCKKEFEALQAKIPASARLAVQQNVHTGVGKKLNKSK